MVKNSHPPKGASRVKSQPGSSKGEEDTSFIIFGDEKKRKKKEKKQDDGEQAPQAEHVKGKGKDKTQSASAGDDVAAAKPSVRTLIGGASWTGKLPVNMLSEHCQKQKWEKPEYTMNKSSDGFLSTVILKCTNPKTRETTVLPKMIVPSQYQHLATQPTAIQARHFAATYALFRVCSAKNIHMAMPPTYRELWRGLLEDLKKQDIQQGRQWLYEADPFLALKDQQDAKARAAKRREEDEKRKLQEQNQSGVSAFGFTCSEKGDKNRVNAWKDAPKLEMARKVRAEAEALTRDHALWNPHNVSLGDHERHKIIDEVSRLGFRTAHVEEATELCKDREEVIEWLLVHVPEDDLPKWTLPEGYVAGVSLASGDLKKDAAIKRLAAGGYATDFCEEVLDKCNGNERKAAVVLQESMLGGNISEGLDNEEVPSGSESDSHSTEETDIWTEEQGILSSIFPERFKVKNADTFCISMTINGIPGDQFSMQIRRPPGPYPRVLPMLTINAQLPAYIRLSIAKQALEHARSHLLGEPMVFSIIDWVEQTAPNIIKNPGRLSELSPAASIALGNRNRSKAPVTGNRHRMVRPVNTSASTKRSRIILEEWQSRQLTAPQKRMVAARRLLPAWELQEAVVNAVNSHQVVIISGETGSGKSTQCVQFVLDDMIKRSQGEAANILCTQPRRISAIGLADRVAEERCSIVGKEIGYSIRGESKRSPGVTKITFMTTGVLLRRLQTSSGSFQDATDALADVTHIFIDEVHERSLDTDFLLIVLRDVIQQRKDLKLVLMSATLHAEMFEAYFGLSSSVTKLEIQGRTHPVHDLYLEDITGAVGFDSAVVEREPEQNKAKQKSTEGSGGNRRMIIDYDLIAQIIQLIDKELGETEGGVLVFLPGIMEIDRTLQTLRKIPGLHVLPLHASLLPAEQRRVFPAAPRGKRKIIASTNVAETSITIQDIVAVIDTGRVKETSYDPQTNMVRLEETWASRAACKQRRGRAGRVRAGHCYKLYTRNTEMTIMAEQTEPEIRRIPLEQLCLSVKAMGIIDVSSFLSGALTPPDTSAVEGAITLLERMGAIDGDSLTALGRHLSAIPADLRCGKLLLYGSTFGCLESALTIAGILTARSPFVSPQDRRDEAKAARVAFAKGQGDLLCDLRAYEAWTALKMANTPSSAISAWCNDHFLSSNTLADITSNRAQYMSSLIEAGWVPPDYATPESGASARFNKHNDNDALIRALLAASFSPQVARIAFPEKKYAAGISGSVEVDPEARSIKYFNEENGRVFVHPSSTLFDAQGFGTGAAFMSYWAKMQTSKVFVRELTPFNAYTLLLFCGAITVDTHGRGLIVDGWLRLRGWARIGALTSRLRMMFDDLLARKVNEPDLDISEDRVIRLVRRMVELNGLDQ